MTNGRKRAARLERALLRTVSADDDAPLHIAELLRTVSAPMIADWGRRL
jgi:hypothetical protein